MAAGCGVALGCGLTERDPRGELDGSGGSSAGTGAGGNSAGTSAGGNSADGGNSAGTSSGGGFIGGGDSAGGLVGSGGSGGAPGNDGLRALFKLHGPGIDQATSAGPGMSIQGFVTRGPIHARPLPMRTRAVFEVAGCRLMVPDLSRDACEPGFLNVEGECASDQNAVDIGEVRLSGFDEQDQSYNSTTHDVPPSYPGRLGPTHRCEEGALIGAKSGAFTMSTSCIAQLNVSSGPVRFRADEPSVVTWDPPQKEGISRIEVHFGFPHWPEFDTEEERREASFQVHCDAADTGSFTLPASMVNRALELGVAHFNTVVIQRVSVANPPNPPGLTFQMEWWVQRSLDTGVR